MNEENEHGKLKERVRKQVNKKKIWRKENGVVQKKEKVKRKGKKWWESKERRKGNRESKNIIKTERREKEQRKQKDEIKTRMRKRERNRKERKLLEENGNPTERRKTYLENNNGNQMTRKK